ncbi:GGDEF domain-containing protein [Mesorhizobium sp. SB112]|uniref:GGDEF domain-containing protein n=1 Tax=Mesorhizobium sp. SB112 TaxID=3151853 RepID=UPI00326508B9
MTKIFLKATIVTLLAVGASLLAALTVVPALGGVVDGNAWLMCIVCPLVVAWPASAYTFWQNAKLQQAHRELSRAHAHLRSAHRNLTKKASLDDMTGMLNRESFFVELESLRDQPNRGALLIIDADHFKKINDGFGHLAGDDALLSIVAAIKRAVRSGDVLGRIGGEEFGAFLVGASDEEAELVAERVRREVEAIRFRPTDQQIIPLTVSIGGTLCAVGASVRDIMRRADAKLYEAKRGGRNLVFLDKDVAHAA